MLRGQGRVGGVVRVRRSGGNWARNLLKGRGQRRHQQHLLLPGVHTYHCQIKGQNLIRKVKIDFFSWFYLISLCHILKKKIINWFLTFPCLTGADLLTPCKKCAKVDLFPYPPFPEGSKH